MGGDGWGSDDSVNVVTQLPLCFCCYDERLSIIPHWLGAYEQLDLECLSYVQLFLFYYSNNAVFILHLISYFSTFETLFHTHDVSVKRITAHTESEAMLVTLMQCT